MLEYNAFFGPWLIYQVLALVCFAIINVIDTFFVSEERYRDANEVMIVSSLFKVIGIIVVGLLFYSQVLAVPLFDIGIAVAAGFLFALSYWHQMRALFSHNDVGIVQVFWNLSTPLTTLLAWLFLHEELRSTAYIGVGIVTIGAMVVSFVRTASTSRFFVSIFWMVVIYSFAELLTRFSNVMDNVDPTITFPYICAGQLLFGGILWFATRKEVRKFHLFERTLAKENALLFLISETFEILSLFFMTSALRMAPLTAYYVTTSSFLPIVIMITLVFTNMGLRFYGKGLKFQEMFEVHHRYGWWIKGGAALLMVYGLSLIV